MTDHSHDALAHKGDPSLDRLLFFSDGVFAIAITLLAIELHVPEGWDGRWASLWGGRWPMFAAFGLSFLIIGIFWNAHRRLFLNMARFTQGVFVFNLLLLGGIALMPFATTLLYEHRQGGEGFAIYLSLVVLIGLLQGATYGYAAFVADVIRPRQHWMLRASAMTMQALTPGLACALSLFIFGHGPGAWIAALSLALAALIGFRVFAARRYGVRATAA